jgi:hypothetical protein
MAFRVECLTVADGIGWMCLARAVKTSMTRAICRRAIGLIAAYAIGLQILLSLGAALPTHVAAMQGDLCVTRGDGTPPAVPAHDATCCLAMGCHGGAGVAPQSDHVAIVRVPKSVAPGAAAAAPLASVADARANWPRAPPRA